MRQLEDNEMRNDARNHTASAAIDPMSASLAEMQLPRGRLLMIENGVEIEIQKREMPESKAP